MKKNKFYNLTLKEKYGKKLQANMENHLDRYLAINIRFPTQDFSYLVAATTTALKEQ